MKKFLWRSSHTKSFLGNTKNPLVRDPQLLAASLLPSGPFVIWAAEDVHNQAKETFYCKLENAEIFRKFCSKSYRNISNFETLTLSTSNQRALKFRVWIRSNSLIVEFVLWFRCKSELNLWAESVHHRKRTGRTSSSIMIDRFENRTN